jgi:neutral ceramidase
MLRVGFSRVEITPPLGTLCALGLDDEAKEMLGPVFVRATVLGEGQAAVGLLSADLIGLCRQEMDELRPLVSAATAISPERVIIHATHTHESPSVRTGWTDVTRPWGLVWHDEAFYDRVKAETVRAFRQAVENSFRATVSYGKAPVAGIASNRRIVLADGRLVLRGSRASAEHRLYPEGWIDPFLRLIVFRDVESEREHWLLNYCCHPSAAGGDEGPYITGDFPGKAMLELERTRPQTTSSYLTGCCGNINPGKYTGSSNAPQARQTDTVRLGQLLAQGALRAREAASEAGNGPLTWSRVPVRLRLLDRLLDRAALERNVETHANIYLQRHAAGERMPGGGQLYRLVNHLMVHRLAVDGYLDTEVAALGLGELGIVFLPGECFLELDAALRERFPNTELVAAETCDYTTGYIVPQSAYNRGGYEASAALCHPGAYDTLLDAASQVLRNVCR